LVGVEEPHAPNTIAANATIPTRTWWRKTLFIVQPFLLGLMTARTDADSPMESAG
jgi:hypothetical protein